MRPSRPCDRVENEWSCEGEAGNSPAKVHLSYISSNQIARAPCGSIQNPPGHSELPLNLVWRIQADGSRATADPPRGVRLLWNAKNVLFCSFQSEVNNKTFRQRRQHSRRHSFLNLPETQSSIHSFFGFFLACNLLQTSETRNTEGTSTHTLFHTLTLVFFFSRAAHTQQQRQSKT